MENPPDGFVNQPCIPFAQFLRWLNYTMVENHHGTFLPGHINRFLMLNQGKILPYNPVANPPLWLSL